MNKLPIEIGSIVFSKAGRDMGRPFIVIQEIDKDFVMVADGKLRTMDRLKTKRRKHLKPTGEVVQELREICHDVYGNDYYLAGEGVSTYDLMDTVTSDMLKINLAAVLAVFLILMIMFRKLLLPLLLVASIETAIWDEANAMLASRKPDAPIVLLGTSVEGLTEDFFLIFSPLYDQASLARIHAHRAGRAHRRLVLCGIQRPAGLHARHLSQVKTPGVHTAPGVQMHTKRPLYFYSGLDYHVIISS